MIRRDIILKLFHNENSHVKLFNKISFLMSLMYFVSRTSFQDF